MRKRTIKPSTNAMMGSIDDARARYGLGARSIRDVAAECNAVVRIGKSVRFNFQIMDAYFTKLSGK